MRYVAIGFGILLTLSFAISGAAAQNEPAFTGTGKTCADITWSPSALERFPNIGTVCQSLVQRDGKLYAQFNGVVQRRGASSLYIRFEGGERAPGGDRAVRIKPRTDMMVQTSKGPFSLRDAQRGQEFTVYIPSDHFVLNLGDEIAVADQVPIEEVVPVTEEEPMPAPAEPAQVAEATPPAAPPVAAPVPEMTPPAPPPAVAAAAPAPTPQPPKESPWTLLIVGVVVAVIVIGVLTMRRKSK